MIELQNIAVSTKSIQKLLISQECVNTVKPEILRHMLFLIYCIREFETRLLDLKDMDQVHGPVHSSIGQEGTAVGAMQLLNREDLITSTHRGHHHFLAKAYNAYAGKEFDPLENIPGEIRSVTRKALEEILGLFNGYCRGRGGSMHLGDRFSGCIGTNAIVAGGVPCAVGTAWAYKMDSKKAFSVAFLGDGAVNQGVVHEVMNMAALWDIPVLFFIENNLYAVATSAQESCCVEHLAQRGLGYDIPGLIVDGMDPIAVFKAMEQAKDYMVSKKKGPFIIEAKTYRFLHQAQGLPGSSFGYRTKEEERKWKERDPHKTLADLLMEKDIITAKQNQTLLKEAESIVGESVSAVTKKDSKGSLLIKEELFPPKTDLFYGIRSDGKEFQSVQFKEKKDFKVKNELSYIDVIPQVILRRMEESSAGVILGEEVGHMKGGAFMATKGIYKKYRDRVIDTPISENGFVGMALGLALLGKKPIIEIMYPDFSLVAADQLFNQVAKFRYMYGNQYDIPLICRTRVGIGSGYGAQHSMEPAGYFGNYPGWRIIAPSTPFDYIGLFNSAFRCLDPVLVVEHAMLYPVKGEVPQDRDFYIKLDKADIKREGQDITCIAFSHMVLKALKAAGILSKKGIELEVVDLRSVDYSSIDYYTVGQSLKKTGRIMVLEEGIEFAGIGAQISYEIQKRFFDYLDGEIIRVAGKNTVMPVSKAAEYRALPQVEDIIEAAYNMMPWISK